MAHVGGCLCRSVRFECGDIGSAGYCHCEDCRRSTGSAFNISVRCPVSAFHMISGDLGHFTKIGASGAELTRYFCQSCGSPIYTSSPRNADLVFIKAGVLDDPSTVKPTLEAWVNSKVDWSMLHNGLESFEHSRGLAV